MSQKQSLVQEQTPSDSDDDTRSHSQGKLHQTGCPLPQRSAVVAYLMAEERKFCLYSKLAQEGSFK